jgi:hypothetical protein
VINPEEIDVSERTVKINKLTSLPSGDLTAEDGRTFRIRSWNSKIEVGCPLRIEAVLYPFLGESQTEFFE